MLLGLVELLFLDVVRYVGWVVLKVVTLGRYRRAQGDNDMFIEGSVGFATLAAISFCSFHWAP